MACVACVASAQEDVTAQWSFQNDLPVGICDATNYEGVTADIESTVEGVYMHVDATNGKLNCVGRTNAQFNSGTILQVPVKSTNDIVTVIGYPNYCGYTVGGVANGSESTVAYTAKTADVAQGYVEIISTSSNCYIYGVEVTFVSNIQEKQLYVTDFTEWNTYSRTSNYSSPDVYTVTTKYSHEDLSFTLAGVGCDPAGTNSKFSAYTGYLITAKYPGEESVGEPYCVTSPLASITKFAVTQAATGGSRGLKVSIKGDEDDDWTVLHNSYISSASGETLEFTVNRTNAQLKFEAVTLTQNAYIVDLDIYGYEHISPTPVLGLFGVNGVTYAAADICDEDANGNLAATIKISKTETMISEANPLTDIVADNGEVTNVTYTATDNGPEVTIVVEANGDALTYVLSIVWKPDYTLSYIDTDGTTVLATQTVEEDGTIGEFVDVTALVTVADGYTYRGLFATAAGGRKYTTAEVITSDLSLYAVATATETMNGSERYTFDLTSEYFYAEDHEAFNPTGGYYYNNHGWYFPSSGSIDILVGGHAYIIFGLCAYGGSNTVSLSDAEGNVIGTVTAPVSSDGATETIEYTGGAGTLTVKFTNGIYLHSLTVANVEETGVEKNEQGYYMVDAGNAGHFLTVLEIANATASADERTYIFLPDGTYDLGSTCLTTISGKNISIIGQSMDNTIIVNTPEEEGIGVTATLLITATGTYLQDLTLQNAYPYYTAGGSAGRAVCIQDKGTKTICKNVRMLSYQDTYYSNNQSGQYYWETSDIHGTVDFFCGGGAAYFKNCDIFCESRTASSNSGSCTITAPATTASQRGYIFDGCTIDNACATYNFGRTWSNNPECVWMNTTLVDPSALASTRWAAKG